MVSRFLSGGAEAKKASAFPSSSLSIALPFPCNHKFNALRNWIATTNNRLELKFGQTSSVLCTHNVKCIVTRRNNNTKELKIRATLNFETEYQLVLESWAKTAQALQWFLLQIRQTYKIIALKISHDHLIIQSTSLAAQSFKTSSEWYPSSDTWIQMHPLGRPKGCAEWLTLLLSKSTNCIFGITIEARVRFPMSNRYFVFCAFVPRQLLQGFNQQSCGTQYIFHESSSAFLVVVGILSSPFFTGYKVKASRTNKIIREFASV